MSKWRKWGILTRTLVGPGMFLYCFYIIKTGVVQAVLLAMLCMLLAWLWFSVAERAGWISRVLLGIAALLAVILVIQLGTIMAAVLAVLAVLVGSFLVPWVTDKLVKWRRG